MLPGHAGFPRGGTREIEYRFGAVMEMALGK